jgi:hypothetical protein
MTNDDLEQTILDALTEASGRPWWITIRLCQSLRAHWEFVGGEMASHGFVPYGVPLSFWLDGAYRTMVKLLLESAEPRNAADWTRALTTPPPSEGRKFDEVAESDAFLAAMSMAR